MGEMLTILRTEGKDAKPWIELLDHLNAASRPQTVKELSQLMQTFSEVKKALFAVQEKPRSIGLTLSYSSIQVDDIIEQQIFEQANMYLKPYVTHQTGATSHNAPVSPFQIE